MISCQKRGGSSSNTRLYTEISAAIAARKVPAALNNSTGSIFSRAPITDRRRGISIPK
jgi:hypothetical protein